MSLFLVFFKIGLFTFGGGYAMLALIEDICVEKKKWITHEEMMDITVIAESRSDRDQSGYVCRLQIAENSGSNHRNAWHDNTVFLYYLSDLAVPGPFPGDKMGIKCFSGDKDRGCHFDNRCSS